MTYRAAVIGCGRIGCGFIDDPLRGPTSTHAGSYQAVDGVGLVAVCDLDYGKASRCAEKLGVRAYDHHLPMLVHETLDIVSICTPPNTHGWILHDVAATPGIKAIYCEKPITTNISAAESMVRECDDHGILLMINHQRRFSLLHQKIARGIKYGHLGRIQHATGYYGRGVSNSGSHLFDLLRFYLGEVEVVSGWQSPNSSHLPDDPNIDGWLWFEGNVPVAIQACDADAYAAFGITIHGTKGRVRVTSCGRQATLEHVGDCQIFTGIRELSAPPSVLTGELGTWIPRGIEHMLNCLKTGAPPISSGRDGLAALKIIEALKHSAGGG